jgi:hypothetical protein
MTQDVSITSDHINGTTIYVVWREHLWNVSVLQRVHLSNLVKSSDYSNFESKLDVQAASCSYQGARTSVNRIIAILRSFVVFLGHSKQIPDYSPEIGCDWLLPITLQFIIYDHHLTVIEPTRHPNSAPKWHRMTTIMMIK